MSDLLSDVFSIVADATALNVIAPFRALKDPAKFNRRSRGGKHGLQRCEFQNSILKKQNS
ncbi:MAG: hypothetical protein U0Z53_13555 [Blastocatellia bacterium]